MERRREVPITFHGHRHIWCAHHSCFSLELNGEVIFENGHRNCGDLLTGGCEDVVCVRGMCVWGGQTGENMHIHVSHTLLHCYAERYCKTPEVFTPVHHDGIGLCSQCELIIGRFPLVEVLIEPVLAIIKWLGVDNVHEASE